MLLFFYLNFSGFCFLKMRWLSERKKIEAVFNYYNSRSTLPADTFKNGILTIKSYNHIQYSSFEEYEVLAILANVESDLIDSKDFTYKFFN
jgi:hypothetical protein